MGALLGKCGIAFTIVLDCATPAKAFWKTLTEDTQTDAVASAVQSVEVLTTNDTKNEDDKTKNNTAEEENDDESITEILAEQQNNKLCVGTRWIEKRVYDCVMYEVHRTVTSMDEDSLTISVGMDFAPNTHDTRNASSTGTIAVLPRTNTTCQVVASWAFAASYGFCENLRTCFCRPYYVRISKHYFQLEMEELVAEAEKRYQQHQESNNIHERPDEEEQ